MLSELLKFFEVYTAQQAPFMHQQFQEWQAAKPLQGLSVIHHVPLVPNTLLKIACVVAGGAEVTLTNPDFMLPHPKAISALAGDRLAYVPDLNQLRGKHFDIYFDCGAELYRTLGAPRRGAVELTATGDHFYRAQSLAFPVVSIDRTRTKQLETLFGSASSTQTAIHQLTGIDTAKKSWLVFGFGKIGRGITYYCYQQKVPIIVVDTDSQARSAAQRFGLPVVDPQDVFLLRQAIEASDIIVTATGQPSLLSAFPKAWFSNKILANMGAEDEYGPVFAKSEVLYNKYPVNFALDDPTPMEYIDPTFYAHNVAAIEILNNASSSGVMDLPQEIDSRIINSWCQYHHSNRAQMDRWFV